MVIYTELTAKEISKLANQFSLGSVIDFQTLKGGSTNSNYLLITEKGKHILTICEDKPHEQIQTLLELLQHLENHHFQTSKVIKLVNGDFLLEYDNKPVYLKSYLEGVVPEQLSLMSLEKLGKKIAKLHMIPILNSLPDTFPYGFIYFKEVTTSSYTHSYIDWLLQKSKYLEEHIPNDLPRGLVHGDIFTDNLLEDANGQIFILDFEEVSHSPLIFDIGMALVGVCSDNNKISLPMAKCLIKGYQQERELNQIEKNSIWLFTIYAAIATSFWRFRQFHLKIPSPEKFDRYKQMQDIADKLFQMNNSEFMRQVGLS